MKKTFCFIRHGESESNAGEKTRHPRTINLTQKGHQQAKDKAAAFSGTPDMVITSGYVRTKQTAQPFLEKFGDVPQVEWNIHEFTYLSALKYENTTNTERLPHTEKYWEKADPFYKEDATAESFAEFAERCRETVERMKQHKEEMTVAFSHGYFINGILFYLAGGFNKVNADTMRNFWLYHSKHKIENCAKLEFEIKNDGSVVFKNHDMKKPEKPAKPFRID